ncbi:MAG: DUF1289 domain-containing protein [Betaproteobacteria bacterium]
MSAYRRGASGDVPSPCIDVCAIERGTGLCRGCFRSLDEIANWSRYSAEQKRAVLAALPVRKSAPRRA